MTTTSLDVLMERRFTCSGDIDEDLWLRARAELREIQRRRDVLIVSSRDARAWVMPYNSSTLESLVHWAESGNHDEFVRIAKSFPELVPQHHFYARHYSEVVVL